jgi:uncharacterized membrane protein
VLSFVCVMRSTEGNSQSLLTWAPLVSLSAAAAYLAARYDDIPPTWVVHWDLAGTPNGSMTRTIPGVFGLLIVGLFVWVALEIVGGVLLARGAPELLPVREANVRALRLISAAMALLFSLLAISLPLGPHVGPGVIVPCALALIVVPMVMGGIGMKRALRIVRARGYGDAVEGYRGLHYSNAKDTRLWVPKIGGNGYTINFAHPWAWPVMALLVALPIALTVVLVVNAGRH